jgi:hypothetical protein
MMMKRFIPLVLIMLGILLSLGALSQLYWSNRTASLASVKLPDQLAGLPITDSQSGAKAISEIADLHGKEFPVDFGAVGVYGNRDITLWIAGAPSEQVAFEMTNAMQEKIAEGNSPFTPVSEINDRNRKVYALEGMGQKHYYFQAENLVIWLAVDPAFADDALRQILEVYS